MLVRHLLHQIAGVVVVVQGLQLGGQGGVPIPPDVVQPGVAVQEVHVDQILPKGIKPVVQALPRRAGGDVVHHHLKIGVVYLPVHPAGPLQAVDQVALVGPEGLHSQLHPQGFRHPAEPAQVIPAAGPHGRLVLSPVAPAGVDHYLVGPQLGGQADGVGEVAEGVLQAQGLLGGVLILIGHAGRGDGHHPHAVIPQLLPEGGYVVIAGVIQPEVGRAAPELNLFNAQPLLAVQEIVQREAPVVLVHVDQLAALDSAHAAPPLVRASTARRWGQSGLPP